MLRPNSLNPQPRRQFLGQVFGVAALSLCQLGHGDDGDATKDVMAFLGATRREAETILGLEEKLGDCIHVLWAHSIGKWMDGVSSLWNQYPVQSTADLFVKQLVDSDDVGFLVASLVLSPTCFPFTTLTSIKDGPLGKARASAHSR